MPRPLAQKLDSARQRFEADFNKFAENYEDPFSRRKDRRLYYMIRFNFNKAKRFENERRGMRGEADMDYQKEVLQRIRRMLPRKVVPLVGLQKIVPTKITLDGTEEGVPLFISFTPHISTIRGKIWCKIGAKTGDADVLRLIREFGPESIKVFTGGRGRDAFSLFRIQKIKKINRVYSRHPAFPPELMRDFDVWQGYGRLRRL